MANRRRTKPGDPLKCVALVRCSTTEQRNSPAAQRRAIQAWADHHGVEIVAEHADLGVSGSCPVEKRPGLLAAIEDLREHGAGCLVVARRDRFARSVVVAAVAEQLVEKAGGRVVSADGSSDGDGPDGWLLKTIRDAFAQYELMMIRARTKAALTVVKSRGRRLGGVAFGWRVSKNDRDRLEPVPGEQVVIRMARRLRARGRSLRNIARHLDDRGVRPRAGGSWHPEQVQRILRYAERAG